MPNFICGVSSRLKDGLAIAYSYVFIGFVVLSFFFPEEDCGDLYTSFQNFMCLTMYHLKPHTAFTLMLGTLTWSHTQFQQYIRD